MADGESTDALRVQFALQDMHERSLFLEHMLLNHEMPVFLNVFSSPFESTFYCAYVFREEKPIASRVNYTTTTLPVQQILHYSLF